MNVFNIVYIIFMLLKEGTFLIGGGGWAGASEGRVLIIFFTNWGGSNLFYSQPGEGNSFFWQGKNYSMSLLLSLSTRARIRLCFRAGFWYKISLRKLLELEPTTRSTTSLYSPFGFGNHPRSSSFSGLVLSLVSAADVPSTESEE